MITKERFAEGLTLSQYLDQMRMNRDRFVQAFDAAAVRPDGYAQNLIDGIIRARYRESRTTPKPLTPGEVTKFTIDLWATSHAFLPGHRVRLEISSSNFPRFDRNLNTGEDQATSTRWQTARQTIFHDGRYPSHITLPVIPR